ncbi:unnamed protein product, partial [Brenthis ino]
MACDLKGYVQICLFLTLVTLSCGDPQLDLPPLPQVSTQRNPYGFGISSTQSTNNQGNQYDLNRNFQFSTGRPQSSVTPGVYPVSSNPPRINPDISSNGYPSIDYGTGIVRTPSSTLRPYDDRNRDDRIDINSDANFRRNDPNFVRSDPNYVGTNPYSFNRDGNTNSIDDRLNYVNIQQVRDFLLRADDQASKECTNNVAAQWNFETDVNDATQHAAHDLVPW